MAVNREADWSPTDASAVCSEHFDIKDFYCTTSGLRRLSTDAVPKINISVCEEQQPTICSNSHIDVKPTDTEEVIELKHKVRRLEVIANNRKRQINLLWQSKKRMQRKMDQMKAVIEHLIQGKDKWNT